MSLSNKDHRYLWHPFTQMKDWMAEEPVIIVSAEGAVLRDTEGFAFARYAPDGEALYLFRPDQHVAGRRRGLSATWLGDALRRACMTDVPFNLGSCS